MGHALSSVSLRRVIARARLEVRAEAAVVGRVEEREAAVDVEVGLAREEGGRDEGRREERERRRRVVLGSPGRPARCDDHDHVVVPITAGPPPDGGAGCPQTTRRRDSARLRATPRARTDRRVAVRVARGRVVAVAEEDADLLRRLRGREMAPFFFTGCPV